MKARESLRRESCNCGNPKCPLPRFEAILKRARRPFASAVNAARPRSFGPTLSAA